MHSIPKNQIPPNPSVSVNSTGSATASRGAGQKRVVEEISSDESSEEEGQVRPAKKSKPKKSTLSRGNNS